MNSQKGNINRIAVIGMSCIYPDAFNVEEFWENIIEQRVSFRNFPSSRLNEEYFNTQIDPTDKIYSSKGAFIKNYRFDRERFHISKSNYDTADISHWITLETTDNALNMSGIKNLLNSDMRKEIGVIIGNTLTGEQTRSNQLRLRWPYVSNVLKTALKQENYKDEDIANILHKTKTIYKSSFPDFKEDSLAGGLSNTIAGRICNYYDFKGGGFTIDGACSSSLLSVIKGCESILQKDLKVAIVGGVDISLDPFELVGFSRTEALAKSKMLVFDENSNGFWPGEGCGILILADYEFAKENDLNILATIRGWGISSDGKGGITRPEKDGQKIALKKAASKANIQFSDLDYIEAHGTGTKKGDETELNALHETIAESIQNDFTKTYIGSVKGNIGHTKAAAGVAGMIKAICISQKKVIPAASSNINPHSIFNKYNTLILPNNTIFLDKVIPLKIGINSMGFGGINTHVIIEGNESVVSKPNRNNKKVNHKYFDHEVFVFSEDSLDKLLQKVEEVTIVSKNVSFSEFSDLSCTLIKFYSFKKYRLSIVANEPNQLHERLVEVKNLIQDKSEIIDFQKGIYFSSSQKKINLGYLFPGQGNKFMNIDSSLRKIYPTIFDKIPASISKEISSTSTQVAQPSLVNTACIGIDILNKYEIQPEIAIGHSVGELACLYYSKALSYDQVISLADYRGRLMEKCDSIKGSMLLINPKGQENYLIEKINQLGLKVACYNSDDQWVISGLNSNIIKLQADLKEDSIVNIKLSVENAFHSDLMKAVEPEFSNYIDTLTFNHIDSPYVSTVTSKIVKDSFDIKQLLTQQLIDPVLFKDSIITANKNIDLWVEIGVGDSLKKLLQNNKINETISLNLTGDSIFGITNVLAYLITNDDRFSLDEHIRNRLYKILEIESKWEFIGNPCENLHFINDDINYEIEQDQQKNNEEQIEDEEIINETNIGILFKKDLSIALDLDSKSINDESKLLDDLHLNSLYVVQFITKFAKKHQLKISNTLLEYSNASVHEIVQMFLQYNFNGSFTSPKDELKFRSEWIKAFVKRWKKIQQPINSEYYPNNFHQISDSFYSKLYGDTLLIKYDSKQGSELEEFLKLKEIIVSNSSEKKLVFIYSKDVFSSFLKSIYKEKYIKQLSLIFSKDGIVQEDQFYLKISSNKIGIFELKIENTEFYESYFEYTHIQKHDNLSTNLSETILVIGGGKGIALECVRKMSTSFNVNFLLVGRTDLNKDKGLKESFDLLTELGIQFNYFRADITKYDEVKQLKTYIHFNNIIIKGFIHSAGFNKPQKLNEIHLDTLAATYNPKVIGFKNIMEILDKETLEFVISFGSVIGNIGMEGNGEYAFANQFLKNTLEDFQNQFSSIKFLNIEWSVWDQVGMGHDLGLLELLKQNGVMPISIDIGSEIFIDILNNKIKDSSLFVSGNFNELRSSVMSLKNHQYRFVEEIIEHFDDVEFVSEVTISAVTDHYLLDHVFDQNIIFPGVMGIEAGLQNFSYFKNDLIPLSNINIQNIIFHNPILFSDENQEIKIRIIIERTSQKSYQIKIYSSTNQFNVVHFSFDVLIIENENGKLISIEVPNSRRYNNENIYEHLLFHGNTFKVIESYQFLTYKEIVANVDKNISINLFNQYLGNKLIGLPTNLMDGLLHSVQICVPNKTLLPISIKNIISHVDHLDEIIDLKIHATENYNDKIIYNYDIQLVNSNNECLIEFHEVSFKNMNRSLKIPYSKEQVSIILNRYLDEHSNSERLQSDFSFDNQTINNFKRYDGKPLMKSGNNISRSYSNGIESIILSTKNTAIDFEIVNKNNDSHWKNILTGSNFDLALYLSKKFNEDFNISATRLWTVIECLKKVGILAIEKIEFIQSQDDLFFEFQFQDYKILNISLEMSELEQVDTYSISIIR